MLKRRFAVFGIIIFAASLFPWNAFAIDRVQNNDFTTQTWTKEKKHSKAGQGKITSSKKPKATKRKA